MMVVVSVPVAVVMTIIGVITIEFVHLMGCQHLGKGFVAYLQVASVMTSVQPQEVVVVDIIHSVVLISGETQHHGHVICSLAGFHPSHIPAHGRSRGDYRHHHYEGKHHLFHNRQFFNGSTFCDYLLFTLQNYGKKLTCQNDYP